MPRKPTTPTRVRGSNQDKFKHAETIKVGSTPMPGPDTVQPGSRKVTVTVDDGGQGRRLVKNAAAVKRVLRGSSATRSAGVTSQIAGHRKKREGFTIQ